MIASRYTGAMSIAALALALFPGAAVSQVVWTIGIGGTSCQTAMKNIAKNPAVYEAHYLTWIGGYISGYNAAMADYSSTNVRVGEGFSNDKIAQMLKAKCAQDGRKPLPVVASEIRDEMAKFRK
jgi:hypothetical protein